MNGKIGDFKLVYTGSYMTRKITEQQDYTNYSRTPGGMYYQCTGSATGFGKGSTYCYSPVANWNDQIRNTHHSEELRIQSPEGKRIRAIAGAYYENYKIYDIQRFNYTSIPGCTAGPDLRPTSGLRRSGHDISWRDGQPARAGTGRVRPLVKTRSAVIASSRSFGSVDFDILPNLTLTGGTRYYNYKEYELGSQFETYTSCYQVAGMSGHRRRQPQTSTPTTTTRRIMASRAKPS